MDESSSESKPIHWSVGVYRALVSIYPPVFRAEYGGLMVQAFRDRCREADRAGGPAGMLALWAQTLADVFLSVIEQYANRGAVMTKSKWIRLSGWFLAASGLIFFAGWAAMLRPDYDPYNAASLPIDRFINKVEYPLLVLGMLFTAVGVLGLWVRFGERAGGPGRAGLALSMIGSAMGVVGTVGLSIHNSSPYWELNLLGMTAVFMGLGIFGVQSIRRNLLGRWSGLPLWVSLPWPLLFLIDILLHSVFSISGETPAVLVTLVFTFSFAGLAAIGYLLQSEGTSAPIAPA